MMRRVVLCGVVALVSVSGWAQPGSGDLPAKGICAHRGASATHPENTLAAFREAARLGAQMIEFDVYLTRDKRLVVIHDPTVDRTTDGAGKVADLTLEEIKKLDAGVKKGAEFRGERVPTLEEALSVMPVNVWLNVHLKGGAELGRRTAEVLRDEGRLGQAFMACESEAAKAAREVAPGVLICCMDRQDKTAEYVEKTIELKADFIQLSSKTIPADLAELCAKLKAHGIRINYFGVESEEGVRALFEAGVDFPLVNDVEPMMKIAAERGIEPVASRMRVKEQL